MFATLVGGYPRDPRPDGAQIDSAIGAATADALVREVMAEQLDAGLGLLTDGNVRWDDPLGPFASRLPGLEPAGPRPYFDTHTRYLQRRAAREPRWTGPITVDAWRFAASAAAELAAERGMPAPAVKQCLVGPYTLARLSDAGTPGRERLALAIAEALNAEIRALAAAGAPVIQLDEDALTLIGRDEESERRIAAEALRRATSGLDDVHLCLSVGRGDALGVGPDALFDLPFRSYLFDLIAGPDNWKLIAVAPGNRGVICGVADARTERPDEEPVMVWAAHYAASTRGRGIDRVALAPSAGLELLPRDRARAKMGALGEAARKASITDPRELARLLDPRAVDKRSAALGFYQDPSERPEAAARAARAARGSGPGGNPGPSR